MECLYWFEWSVWQAEHVSEILESEKLQKIMNSVQNNVLLMVGCETHETLTCYLKTVENIPVQNCLVCSWCASIMDSI